MAGKSLWRRHRVITLAAGVIAWTALISTLHIKGVWVAGTAKGAQELLEIGALPVT